jgi:hypothetical protein
VKRLLFLVACVLGTAGWWWVLSHPENPPPGGQDPVLLYGLSLFLGLSCGVIAGLVGIVVRGVAIAPPAAPLLPGERLLAAVPANHVVGVEARGGRLCLTTHAVHFVPHRFNLQLDVLSVLLDDITNVGASPTEVGVTDMAGRQQRLRVNDGTGVADILAQMAAASPEARARALDTGLVRAPWIPV